MKTLSSDIRDVLESRLGDAEQLRELRRLCDDEEQLSRQIAEVVAGADVRPYSFAFLELCRDWLDGEEVLGVALSASQPRHCDRIVALLDDRRDEVLRALAGRRRGHWFQRLFGPSLEDVLMGPVGIIGPPGLVGFVVAVAIYEILTPLRFSAFFGVLVLVALVVRGFAVALQRSPVKPSDLSARASRPMAAGVVAAFWMTRGEPKTPVDELFDLFASGLEDTPRGWEELAGWVLEQSPGCRARLVTSAFLTHAGSPGDNPLWPLLPFAPSPAVVELAIEHSGEARTVQPFHGDEEVRGLRVSNQSMAALVQLAEVAPDAFADALERGTGDRLALATAMACARADIAIPVLLEALDDPTLAHHVYEALRRSGASFVNNVFLDDVREALESGDVKLACNAARLLGAFEPSDEVADVACCALRTDLPDTAKPALRRICVRTALCGMEPLTELLPTRRNHARLSDALEACAPDEAEPVEHLPGLFWASGIRLTEGATRGLLAIAGDEGRNWHISELAGLHRHLDASTIDISEWPTDALALVADADGLHTWVNEKGDGDAATVLRVLGRHASPAATHLADQMSRETDEFHLRDRARHIAGSFRWGATHRGTIVPESARAILASKYPSWTAELTSARLRYLEEAMIQRARWPVDAWETIFTAPTDFASATTSHVLWGIWNERADLLASFRVSRQGEYLDVDDRLVELPSSGEIGVLHRLDLADVDRRGWATAFAELGLTPGFDQLDRPRFRPDDPSLTRVQELSDRPVKANELQRELCRSGWIAGVAERGKTYTFLRPSPGDDVTAILSIDPGLGGGEQQWLEGLIFIRGYHETEPSVIQPLPLSEVSPVVYSETLHLLLRAAPARGEGRTGSSSTVLRPGWANLEVSGSSTGKT